MTGTRRFAALLGCTLVLMYAAPARAQYAAANHTPALVVSTTTTSSAVAAGVVMLTVVSVRKSRDRALRIYLQDNELAVRLALSAGAGPAVEDLAAFFAVSDPQLGRFGMLLRRERQSLMRHAFTEFDVVAFVARVTDAMVLDPELRSCGS